MDMTLHVEAYVGQFKYYATMLIIQNQIMYRNHSFIHSVTYDKLLPHPVVSSYFSTILKSFRNVTFCLGSVYAFKFYTMLVFLDEFHIL